MVVLLPVVFFDERNIWFQEKGGKQYFQYIEGENGIGKSYIIYITKDIFRLKDELYILLLINANGNVAAFIDKMTFYSIYNIGFEDKTNVTKTISEEEKLQWKHRVILIVDEISQIDGLMFAIVNN